MTNNISKIVFLTGAGMSVESGWPLGELSCG